MDVIFARALGRAWPHLGFDADRPVWVVTGGDPCTALRAAPSQGMMPRVLAFDALVRLLYRRLDARAALLGRAEEVAIAAAVCAELGLAARLGPDAPMILLDLPPAADDAALEPELADAAAILRTRLLGVPGRVPTSSAIDSLRRSLLSPGAAFRAWAATLGGLALVGIAALPAPARALLLAFAEALGQCGVTTVIPLRCGRLRGGDDPLSLLVEVDEDPSIAPFATERELRRALVTRALHGDGAVRLRVAIAPGFAPEVEDAGRLVERADPIDAWSEGLTESEAPAGVRAVSCPDGATELDFVSEEVARLVAMGRRVAIGVPDLDGGADAVLWALGRLGLSARFPDGRPLTRWPVVRRFLAQLDPTVLDDCSEDEWEVVEEIRRVSAEVDAATHTLGASPLSQASLFGPVDVALAIDRRSTLIAMLRSARLVSRAPTSIDIVSLASLVDHPAEHRFATGLCAAFVAPGTRSLASLAALVRDGWYGGSEVTLSWPTSADGRPMHVVPWLARWFPQPGAVDAPALPRLQSLAPSEPTAVAPAARRLRITAVETYAKCPIRWWFHDRLKLEEVREPTPEVRPDHRGTAAHGILERFVREWGSRSLDSPAARSLLHALATAAFAELGGADPGSAARQAFLSEEKQRWTDGLLDDRPAGLLAAWLERERTLMAGVVPIAVELAVSLDIDGTELVGRIDRLDRVRDAGVLITDYKTGSAPALSEMRKGLALQMVAYREALARGDALSAVEPAVDTSRIAASFLELRRPGEVDRRGWMGDPELLRALAPSRRGSLPLNSTASAALYEHLRGAVRRMRAGVVHPTLADPDEVGCGACPYRAICRHDPSTALDWAGRDDVQAPLSPEAAP